MTMSITHIKHIMREICTENLLVQNNDLTSN